MGTLWILLPQIASLRKPLERVEGKLDLLLRNAGLEYDPFSDISTDVANAIRSGDKILAIKLYREVTGSNLKDAKEFIEEIQHRQRTR